MGIKHRVIALKMVPVTLDCPEGCEGVVYVFESKKAARKHFGSKVRLPRTWPGWKPQRFLDFQRTTPSKEV